MAIQWRHLLAVIQAQSTTPYYDHVTTLAVSGTTSRALVDPLAIRTANMSFQHLRHMRIANINYTDVKFIMEWMRDLESVCCERIVCSDGQNVSLRIFSDMPSLRSLQLDFAQEYNLSPIPYDFDTHGNVLYKKPTLPTTLETFSLKGIYDREEHMTSAAELLANADSRHDRWHTVELQLVRKYSMLTLLTHLTSLTLGRISAFTSRVWLECLQPCASQLEYLTLMNWPGAGKRESPPMTTTTRIPADASERITEEGSSSLETAIAACFSSLTRAKEIYLDDFVCDIGFVEGISRLDASYQIHIEGLQDQQPYTVHDFKAIKVFGFKISIAAAAATRGDPAAAALHEE